MASAPTFLLSQGNRLSENHNYLRSKKIGTVVYRLFLCDKDILKMISIQVQIRGPCSEFADSGVGMPTHGGYLRGYGTPAHVWLRP